MDVIPLNDELGCFITSSKAMLATYIDNASRLRMSDQSMVIDGDISVSLLVSFSFLQLWFSTFVLA